MGGSWKALQVGGWGMQALGKEGWVGKVGRERDGGAPRWPAARWEVGRRPVPTRYTSAAPQPTAPEHGWLWSCRGVIW